LADIVTGAVEKGPYRQGWRLEQLFNSLGLENEPGPSADSRGRYTIRMLSILNGSSGLGTVVNAVLDPREFINNDFSSEDVVDYLDEVLIHDGYKLLKRGRKFVVVEETAGGVEVVAAVAPSPLSHDFIQAQLDKCDVKLSLRDFDGAITNARTLVEAVLREIERRLAPEDIGSDGDLPKQYKRVTKLLNLDPNKKGLDAPFVEILRGFISIVSGLARLRNTASDAHARSYRPEMHHARLAVNTAKTVVDFLFETFEYQKQTGKIVVSEPG
jgi:hypothetical protein